MDSPSQRSIILRGLGGRMYGGMRPTEGDILTVDSAKCRRGGVVGPNITVGAGAAGRQGSGRAGRVPVRGLVSFPMVGDAGKNCVCAGVRRQVA